MEYASWSERLLAGEGEQVTQKQFSILTAAAELFAQQGYADTTTRQIAQKAKVSDGAIYTYYASKRELLLRISQLIIRNTVKPIFDDGMTELFRRSYTKPEDFLRNFFTSRMKMAVENIILLKILLQEAMFQPEIRQNFLAAIAESQFLVGLAGLKKRGMHARVNDRELAMLLLSGFVGLIFNLTALAPETGAPALEQTGKTGLKESERRAYINYLTNSLAWVWVKDNK